MGSDSSDPALRHRRDAPAVLGYGILTVSSSRGREEDESGRQAEELVQRGGHRVVERRVVRDHRGAIQAALRELLEQPGLDVIVVNGGTGFSPDDQTPEAVAPLLERRLEGFGELFRWLSFEQVGAAAMLSRALAGIAAGKAVFVVPGSPRAVELAVERLILPEAGHLLGQARRRRPGHAPAPAGP